MFEEARKNKPAIILINEINNCFMTERDEVSRRAKTEFLIECCGNNCKNDDLFIVATSSSPWDIDAAIRRRLEKRIYIPLPDLAARAYLLKDSLPKDQTSIDSTNIDEIASLTDGFSCADIIVLVRGACYEPLREVLRATHFKIIKTSTDGKPIYQICSSLDPDRLSMSFLDIPGEQLSIRSTVLDDFKTELTKTTPSVAPAEIANHEEFLRNFS